MVKGSLLYRREAARSHHRSYGRPIGITVATLLQNQRACQSGLYPAQFDGITAMPINKNLEISLGEEHEADKPHVVK